MGPASVQRFKTDGAVYPDNRRADNGGTKFRQPLACARLTIPALKQQHSLSRDREGAVLSADSAEFCKYLNGSGSFWREALHKCGARYWPDAAGSTPKQ
jgi:hypothetical protein